MDCKSAYAGSIPTSASTLENPVDSRLRGFLLPVGKCWSSETLEGGVPKLSHFEGCATAPMRL